jgi:flagellar FliL protein
MAEENLEDDLEKDGEGKGKGKPKPSRRRLILFIVAGVLVFSGIGGGLMFFANNPDSLSVIGLDISDGGVTLAEVKPPEEESYYLELAEIIVDLNVPRGKIGFIRVVMILETGSEDDNRWVRGLMPRIIDATQVYLRQRTPDELRGAVASAKARKGLLEALNGVVRPSVIRNLLFRQLAVQG